MNSVDVNLASLDLNLVAALDGLLEQRSVSGAADAVGREQSAMSHSLARLRAHYGDPLLVRDGWAMRLTPFAEALQPRVSAAAAATRLMFATRQSFDPAETTRQIRIAAPDLCTSLFAGFIADLARLAPQATVKFLTGTAPRQAVLRSQADIGLGFGAASTDANLVLHGIEPLAWCMFAPASHPYRGDTSKACWSASRHVIVSQGGGQDGPIEKASAGTA